MPCLGAKNDGLVLPVPHGELVVWRAAHGREQVALGIECHVRVRLKRALAQRAVQLEGRVREDQNIGRRALLRNSKVSLARVHGNVAEAAAARAADVSLLAGLSVGHLHHVARGEQQRRANQREVGVLLALVAEGVLQRQNVGRHAEHQRLRLCRA